MFEGTSAKPPPACDNRADVWLKLVCAGRAPRVDGLLFSNLNCSSSNLDGFTVLILVKASQTAYEYVIRSV